MVKMFNKKTNNIKDTFYIEVFKEKGFSFDYYIYLTSGVSKKDFEKVNKKINSYLEKKGINVKVICITDKWLKELVDYISKNENLIRIQNNKEEFIESLKLEFKKEYLDSFNDCLSDLIGKSNFNQNITELRKAIKEKMKK